MDIADWMRDAQEYFKDEVEAIRPPEPDEFNSNQLAELLGVTRRTADNLLARERARGKIVLSRSWKNENGKKENLYRFVQDKST